MSKGIFKDALNVLRVFQGCFKKVSIMFQESSRVVSKVFQGSLRGVLIQFQESCRSILPVEPNEVRLNPTHHVQ